MKDALLLIAGILIGFGFWAALPPRLPAPSVVECIHVPHYQVKREVVEVEKACPAPRAPRSCPPHRSLESLALACAEGRLTHNGKIGILVENGK